MPKTVVHTLDGRDNIMLEVIRDHFGVSARAMHQEIRGALDRTTRLLKSKGINYADLRAALVPQQDRREMALVFDTASMTESWYGLPIHTRLIPLLPQGGSHSILVGDYLGGNSDQDALCDDLVEGLVLARSVTYRHSSQFYIVYLNNLTDQMVSNINAGLRDYPHYAGYVDTTYASRFKWRLSTMLVKSHIQHRNFIICGHEDDRPDVENVNMLGYPFEEHGFQVRSIPGDMFGLLLSYKIERPVFPGFESDTEFSLNAVHPEPLPLTELEITVDERKFEYLKREKVNSLRGLGLLDGNPEGLKRMIRDKIAANYIYSMAYNDEFDVTQFNLIIEVHEGNAPFRALVGLKFLADAKALQLITLL